MHLRLGLSKRKHLPVWRILDGTYRLWDLNALKFLGLLNNLKVREVGDNLYSLTIFGVNLEMFGAYTKLLVTELEIWKKWYLPPFSLEGETVLDAGAGCGETAAFYLAQGARKVVAVEIDPVAFDLLRRNVVSNSMNVEAYNESFSERFLSPNIDFAKIDVEGSEIFLLNLERIDIPCLVETHSQEVRQNILNKFPEFHEVFDTSKKISFIVNWP
ncbi:MAG: 50S ribosomal protein L11 methyltransferase [Nitrososphaerales archaeon]